MKKPAVELGPDIYTVLPDTVILSAFSGEVGHDYLWQDNSIDSVFQVSVPGTYSVRVENDLTCVARDTIHVYQLLVDAGVTDLLEPLSNCMLGAAVYPKIEIRNFGTDTIYAGDTVPVRYQLDGGTVVEESALLSERVDPDSTFI